MGSLKVKNFLLSKKLKRSEARVLIIDDNQIRYNQIVEIFNNQGHLLNSVLLDDLRSFEKQLNFPWDLIIFGRAYDLKCEQTIAIIQQSAQSAIPVLLLKPDDYIDQQYATYIHKGIYDVLDLNHVDTFYISTTRALSYSRVMQSKTNLLSDLESVKIQKQELAVEQNKAVALIQEGIHIEANTRYLNLFGLSHIDDIIGLPLLDIIQPEKLADFKSRFKKVTQGQFEQSRFELDTLNKTANSKNPLRIEFIPSLIDDAVQITIEMDHQTQVSSREWSFELNSSTINKGHILKKIQHYLDTQPAKENALIIYSIANCPDQILNSDWKTFSGYFTRLATFIQEQTNDSVFKLDIGLYATLLQAESEDVLKSRLTGLQALEKTQLITIAGQNYQQKIRIGYQSFDAKKLDEAYFEKLIENAYNTHLPKNITTTEFDLSKQLPVPEKKSHLTPALDISLEIPTKTATNANVVDEEIASNHYPIIQRIQDALDQNEIQLKYQQLYDKQDLNLNIYEVTCGFIHDNQWYKVNNLIELDLDPELSAKVDRWILVEACKQLHNFVTQYPEAKLIINLNRHILLNDAQLPELVSKLITIVGSNIEHPLILQFDEEDFAKDMVASQRAVKVVSEYGAEISIRNFGSTISSASILEQFEVAYLTLDQQLTQMLNHEKKIAQLQQQIQEYNEIRPIEIILKNLDDMGEFANAWNVDARYLQGNYFQKKLDHLINVQDQ